MTYPAENERRHRRREPGDDKEGGQSRDFHNENARNRETCEGNYFAHHPHPNPRPPSQQQADYPRQPQSAQYGSEAGGRRQPESFSGAYAHTVADEQRYADNYAPRELPQRAPRESWRPGENTYPHWQQRQDFGHFPAPDSHYSEGYQGTRSGQSGYGFGGGEHRNWGAFDRGPETQNPGHGQHEPWQPPLHGLHDPDYHQWRAEQIKQLDDDYARWRRERYSTFADEFSQWRRQRQTTASASSGASSADTPEAKGDSPVTRSTAAQPTKGK